MKNFYVVIFLFIASGLSALDLNSDKRIVSAAEKVGSAGRNPEAVIPKIVDELKAELGVQNKKLLELIAFSWGSGNNINATDESIDGTAKWAGLVGILKYGSLPIEDKIDASLPFLNQSITDEKYEGFKMLLYSVDKQGKERNFEPYMDYIAVRSGQKGLAPLFDYMFRESKETLIDTANSRFGLELTQSSNLAEIKQRIYASLEQQDNDVDAEKVQNDITKSVVDTPKQELDGAKPVEQQQPDIIAEEPGSKSNNLLLYILGAIAAVALLFVVIRKR